MPKTWKVLVVAAAFVASAGCAAGSVAQADVEKSVADQLEEQVGQRPEVACKGDLPAEVGATIRCELTADDGSTIGATVEATSVDGDDVKYEVTVDEA